LLKNITEAILFNSTIGLIHTIFAVIAIASGALVLIFTKGTAKHKFIGYVFFLAMLLMNITALFTQSLYVFGPFHWMAIASLLLVSVGVMFPMFFRSHPNWLNIHYDLMLWSYVGLIAAMFSEIIVRVPAVGAVVGGGVFFWGLVIGASFVTFTLGGYLINRNRKKYF
jgi:uncharacterized membrane protein